MRNRGILSAVYAWLQELRNDVLSLLPVPARQALERSWLLVDELADYFFSTGRRARSLRFVILMSLSAIAWALLATWKPVNDPKSLDWGLSRAQVEYLYCNFRNAISSGEQYDRPDLRCYSHLMARSYEFSPFILELPVRLLFSPDYFRHVLMIFLGVWLGFKASGYYTSRLNKLRDERVGEHFLLQAALANPFNTIDIKDADVPLPQQKTPAFLIGGPAFVRVHLENAALFEPIDGSEHILGPTVTQEPNWVRLYLMYGIPYFAFLLAALYTGYIPLIIVTLGSGVVLVLQFTLMRDFIRSSKAVVRLGRYERLRSSLDLRDQQENFRVSGRSRDGIRLEAKDVQVVYSVNRNSQQPSLRNPFPFDRQAIHQLVYGQGKTNWTLALAVSIQAEFRDFLDRHTLNEFLAMIDNPEWTQMDSEEVQLLDSGTRLVGLNKDGLRPEKVSRTEVDFQPRTILTERFYTSSESRAPQRGVKLSWIGVGTWGGPIERIAGQHQEAWRITRQNENNRKSAVLNSLQKDARLTEIVRLIQTATLGSYASVRAQQTVTENELREALAAYANVLREALETAFPYVQQELTRRMNARREALTDSQSRLDEMRRQPASRRRREEEIRLERRLQEITAESAEIQTELMQVTEDEQRVRRVTALLTRYTYPWLGEGA